MTQLAIVGAESALIPVELWDAYKAAAERVRRPHAPNTERAYTAAWQAWGRHCERHDLQALPIEPVHLVGYLEHLTRKPLPPAPNSLRLTLAALVALDKAHAIRAGIERAPLSRHPVVETWLKSWARTHPKAPRKRAAALSPRELVDVLAAAAEPSRSESRVSHASRYARDKAMLCLGICAAVRVSELVALDLGDVRTTPRGLLVFVRRSKTDQHGAGHLRAIHPQALRSICPIEAVAQWLRVRGPSAGPLFCPLGRGQHFDPSTRLGERQAMRIITDRCHAAGLTEVTSHSMRATFGTLAKAKSVARVMDHGNWQSLDVALRYQRQGNLFDDNPTEGLFDGA